MSSRWIAVAALTAVVFTSGCQKKGKADNADAFSSGDMNGAVKSDAAVPSSVVDEMVANFAKVHFATDGSDLDEVSQQMLARNAALMVQHSGIVVEVQGHADERGTTEYNLALGMKRARAVESFMTANGVPTARIRTISYGEERPAVTGHGETAWSENRRAEFRVITGLGATGTTP